MHGCAQMRMTWACLGIDANNKTQYSYDDNRYSRRYWVGQDYGGEQDCRGAPSTLCGCGAARFVLQRHDRHDRRGAINFDHPDAFDWDLLKKQVNDLRNGKAIEQPTYSYILSNRLPETIHVEPKPVIIIEGIMTLVDKKLRDLMDLKIFVDTDPDERLIRNIQRDTIDRGRTVSMVVNRYLDVLKPMHEQFIEPTKRYADLIIPQGGENKRGISILCKYIEGIVPGSKIKE